MTAPFWFPDLYSKDVFTHNKTNEITSRRNRLFQQHGYTSPNVWEQMAGLLKPMRRNISTDMRFLEREHCYRFLYGESI